MADRPMHWRAEQTVAMRRETHFDGRVVWLDAALQPVRRSDTHPFAQSLLDPDRLPWGCKNNCRPLNASSGHGRITWQHGSISPLISPLKHGSSLHANRIKCAYISF